MTARSDSVPDATTAVAQVIRFLETGVAAPGLFAGDVVAEVALGHPRPARVRVVRVDPTDRGFTMEFEEVRRGARGQRSSRWMLRADVLGSTIVDVALYGAGAATQARRA